MKSPAFQFYPKDFMSDLNVASMTMEERGKYITLLCHCWIENGIPAEMPLVKQWLKEGSILSACFYRKNGKIRNKRLDEEREKQIKWSEKSSKGGTKTQQERWGNIKKEGRGKRLRRAKEKGTHTEEEWKRIQLACGDKCVKCGVEKSQLYGDSLCKDHIIPICLGGSDAIENIQPICRNCNTGKTNDTTDYRPKNWKQRLTNHQPIANSSSSSSSSLNKEEYISNDIYSCRKYAGCDICDTIFLIQGIESNDPKAKVPPLFSLLFFKWVDQIRLARISDKRTHSEIRDAILFSQNDAFWMGNILSAKKLRDKIQTLLLQSKRDAKPRGYQSTETYVGRSDKHHVPISDALWNRTVEVLHSEAVKMGEDPQDHRMEFYQKMSFVFEDKVNVNDWHNITKKDPLSLAAFIAERYVRINGGINETH